MGSKEEMGEWLGGVGLESGVWMGKEEVGVYKDEELVVMGDLKMEKYKEFEVGYKVEEWVGERVVGG